MSEGSSEVDTFEIYPGGILLVRRELAPTGQHVGTCGLEARLDIPPSLGLGTYPTGWFPITRYHSLHKLFKSLRKEQDQHGRIFLQDWLLVDCYRPAWTTS